MSTETWKPTEEESLKSLGRTVGRIYKLWEEPPYADPVPNTRLYDADVVLEGFPITHNIARNLVVSLDHLHTLALLLDKAEALSTYAPFTLLRASLETVGQGMWLLGAGTRVEMVTRNLQVELKNCHDAASALKSSDVGASQFENREKRLMEIGANCSQVDLKRLKKEYLRSTDIVDLGSQAFGLAPSLLTAWKGSSGVAHGRSWAMLALTDREEIPGSRNERGAQYHSTADTASVAGTFWLAVVAHDTLHRYFMEALAGRSGTPRHFVLAEVIQDLGQPAPASSV